MKILTLKVPQEKSMKMSFTKESVLK